MLTINFMNLFYCSLLIGGYKILYMIFEWNISGSFLHNVLSVVIYVLYSVHINYTTCVSHVFFYNNMFVYYINTF